MPVVIFTQVRDCCKQDVRSYHVRVRARLGLFQRLWQVRKWSPSKDSEKPGWRWRWRLPGVVISLGKKGALGKDDGWRTKANFTVLLSAVFSRLHSCSSSCWIHYGTTIIALVLVWFSVSQQRWHQMTVNTRFIIPCCRFALQFWLKPEPWPISGKSTTFRVFGWFCFGYSVAWVGLLVGRWPGTIPFILWVDLGPDQWDMALFPVIWVELDWAWEKTTTATRDQSLSINLNF